MVCLSILRQWQEPEASEVDDLQRPERPEVEVSFFVEFFGETKEGDLRFSQKQAPGS